MSRSNQGLTQEIIQSSNPIQKVEVQDKNIERWIVLREMLINGLSGIKKEDVLNDMTAGSFYAYGDDPAAELKRSLDLVKIAAVDENGTRVDYAALKDSSAYRHYRNTLSPGLIGFDPTTLKSRGERLAFWINLYNALVIDAVITLGTKRSVIEGKFGLLTFFRRAAYNVGGFRISLDEIENGILRGNQGHPMIPGKQFASNDPRYDWVIWPPEPRMHFALNCASRSCPPIQFYSAEHLDAQLNLATRNFIEANLIINPAKELLIVSSLFNWYKRDFGGQPGLISFLINHLPLDGRRAWLSKYRDVIRLRYQPYDWGINS